MPIDFGTPINATPNPTGGFKKPVPGGYKCKIVSSKIAPSKASGKPTWYIELDIAEGDFKGAFAKFPRKYNQSLNTELGKQIASRIIRQIVGEPDNKGLIDPAIAESSTFDESTVNGLIIGAIFEQKGKWLDVKTLCSSEYALTNAPKVDEF